MLYLVKETVRSYDNLRDEDSKDVSIEEFESKEFAEQFIIREIEEYKHWYGDLLEDCCNNGNKVIIEHPCHSVTLERLY